MKTKIDLKTTPDFACWLGRAYWLLIGCATGCAASLNGGRRVDDHYRPRVLVEYTPVGEEVSGTRYALIADGASLAMLEDIPGRDPIVIDESWKDSDGDHFVAWPIEGDAEHILIPSDRQAAAFRWVYPLGLYVVEARDKVELPVPKIELEAKTKLVPKGSKL